MGESPSLWKKATIILRPTDNIIEVVVMVMQLMIFMIDSISNGREQVSDVSIEAAWLHLSGVG